MDRGRTALTGKMTVQPEYGRPGKLEQDIEIGHPGQDSLGRPAGSHQPGQDREERTARQGCGSKLSVSDFILISAPAPLFVRQAFLNLNLASFWLQKFLYY
jgi:hypothetical protein